jgi:hypothetical protein
MEDGMAADTQLLQGEVVEDPSSQKLDVEGLLAAFLHALLEEQKAEIPVGGNLPGTVTQ